MWILAVEMVAFVNFLESWILRILFFTASHPVPSFIALPSACRTLLNQGDKWQPVLCVLAFKTACFAISVPSYVSLVYFFRCDFSFISFNDQKWAARFSPEKERSHSLPVVGEELGQRPAGQQPGLRLLPGPERSEVKYNRPRWKTRGCK